MTKITAYKGTFKKKNGEMRDMFFAKLSDLPDTFLDKKVQGTGQERQYPEGMELVWDLEEDNFRVFNYKNATSSLHKLEVNFDA